MAIGLILAPTSISNCQTNWVIALVALVIIVVFNIWGRGMAKIIPIILGVLGAYVVALVLYFIGQSSPNLIQDMPWLFAGGSQELADGTIKYLPIFDFTNLFHHFQQHRAGQNLGQPD